MRHSLAVAFMAALALSGACNKNDSKAAGPTTPPRTQTPPARTEPTKAPEPSSNAVDMRITQDILKALTDTSDLSVNARNIKVACMNGTVTLTGGVDSTTERDRVEAIATGIAGVTRVDNQLEVKTPR